MGHEVHEALDRPHALHPLHLGVDHVEQPGRILADHLGEQIEAPHGHHDVDHAIDLGDGIGDSDHIAVDLDAEHRHDRVPHGLRIGDTHHPHHLVVEQSLHPLRRAAAESPTFGPRSAYDTTVALEFGEDRLVDLVQVDG